MSDLEESDIEPELEPETESELEAGIEEVDGKIVHSGTATSKKLIEAVNSEDEDEDEDDDDDDDDLPIDSETEYAESSGNPLTYIDTNTGESKVYELSQLSPINSDVESDDEDHLKKFENYDTNYVKKFHPECLTGNSTEVESLTKIVRNSSNVIVDENHKTNPFLSKYEKTKVLGQRTKQLNSGAKPFVSVPPNIIDNYLIAQMELSQKKIPIIIRRPLPSGKSEYWKLQDLEII